MEAVVGEGLGGVVPAYRDTQVVVWLCPSGGARLTPAACEAIEEFEVYIFSSNSRPGSACGCAVFRSTA